MPQTQADIMSRLQGLVPPNNRPAPRVDDAQAQEIMARLYTPEGGKLMGEAAKAAGREGVPGFLNQRIFGSSPNTYVHLHADETYAREALDRHAHRGRSLTVGSTGTRHQTAGGLRFDPNRIWTEGGSRRTIKAYNPNATPAQVDRAERDVAKIRESYLSKMRPGKGGIMVSLHNNRGGRLFAGEARKSQSLSLPDPIKGDFILVTNREDFSLLKTSPYNVLLQETTPEAKDDGSLSYAMGAEGARYVNIEVMRRDGAAQKQLEMLRWVEKNLGEKRLARAQ